MEVLKDTDFDCMRAKQHFPNYFSVAQKKKKVIQV